MDRRVRTEDGIRLHAEVEGDGTTILLITGLGYATWSWKRLHPLLIGDARVIAFDNRGAGRSDKPDEPYSIALLADDALAVVGQLGEAPAVVVGFSMGGYIALTLAERHPELVRSLVLLGTTCGGPDAARVPDATLAAWAQASPLPPADFARTTMPLSFAPGWTEDHPDEFEELLSARLAHPTPPFAWRRQFDACEEFLAHGIDAASIRTPALVVHGTEDRVVPYANAELLGARLKNSDLVRLAGAGHLALLERPAEVAAAIEGFFAR